MNYIVMESAAGVEAPIGRPRDTRLDAAINKATLELLAERGYNALSIKAIAERAGTTTPAVYRRWSSKADLVMHAVFRTEGPDVVADTGDIERDIRTMVRWSLEKFGQPGGRAALAGLLAEAPDRRGGVQAQLAGIWQLMNDRLRRAVQDGELRADLDADALIAAISGPAMMAAINRGGRAVSDDTVDALAAIALEGIRTQPAPRRGRHR